MDRLNIQYSHYSLQFLLPSTRGEHEGVLLRWNFPDGQTGYSDLHPWPELGDVPLTKQLQELKVGRLTQMTARSLKYARLDAQARAENRSVFEAGQSVMNHLTFLDPSRQTLPTIERAVDQGFRVFKLKCGQNPSAEVKLLNDCSQLFIQEELLWRLDFNAALSFSEAREYLSYINARECIEFCEDITDKPQHWPLLSEEYEVELASDRITLSDDQSLWRVWKPVISDLKTSSRSLVITNNFDHPLGVMAALYETLLLSGNPVLAAPHGLLSRHMYQCGEYSESLIEDGPELNVTSELGFGFDDLLENEKWVDL